MTGRIFQALPTQTDTTVVFIYKIGIYEFSEKESSLIEVYLMMCLPLATLWN
jgi:hypothetical protein